MFHMKQWSVLAQHELVKVQKALTLLHITNTTGDCKTGRQEPVLRRSISMRVSSWLLLSHLSAPHELNHLDWQLHNQHGWGLFQCASA
jgi:hypothetical protein